VNHSGLKTFAQDARRKLRELVGTRLDYVLNAHTAELRQQAAQVAELRKALETEGDDPLIERVAYTWFNRLAALRFMDANGYHPFGARVITPATANETLPEVLQQARVGALDADLRASIANPDAFDDLLSGRIPVDHPEAQVFKLLLVAACNYYHKLMPFLFEKIGDATELLLPGDLLTEHSIVADFRENLTDQDCQNEEVLGWFYQYYISEKKDEVMGRNGAVPKQDIPAVTQLFTPHWIVRYLVENSLGRLWLLNRPQSRLREKMPYYIEGDAQTDFQKITKPEDIRLLDPAGGSGHMLTYAFDLLYAIYEEEGYDAPEIPSLILRHNLYGVDICDRAVALASFALCMKARAKDSRFFRRVVQPNLISLQELRIGEEDFQSYANELKLESFFEQKANEWINDGSLLARQRFFDSRKVAETLLRLLESRGELLQRLATFGLSEKLKNAFLKFFAEGHKIDDLAASEIQRLAAAVFNTLVASKEIVGFSKELTLGDLAKQIYLYFVSQFAEAKNFGSLIQPCLSENEMLRFREKVSTLYSQAGNVDLLVAQTHSKVLGVFEQAQYLFPRYSILVANPPYMGSGSMNAPMKAFAAAIYPKTKTDTFSMFIERCLTLASFDGFVGCVTMQTWMFLSSFAAMRRDILLKNQIENCVQIGFNSFPELNSKVAQAVAFVLRKGSAKRAGVYFNLNSAAQSADKERVFREQIAKNAVFRATNAEFEAIPGQPIAYWLSPRMRNCFNNETYGQHLASEGAVKTGDNARFIRFIWEVAMSDIGANGPWRKHPKGGPFRKWYGNLDCVVAWTESARQHYKEDFIARIPTEAIWNLVGITWTAVSSSELSFRVKSEDEIPNNAALFVYPKDGHHLLAYLCGLNSCLTPHFLEVLSPTLNYLVGDVLSIPFPLDQGVREAASELGRSLIAASQADWNNFETSWDFHDLPLLRPGIKGTTLAISWQNWKVQCDMAIKRVRELETENNRLFITAYGLLDELKPEVPEEQITLACADVRKDMAAFVSYAVGCMFGRYSLDAPGLILADGGATVQDYLAKVPHPTFAPDADGILPILDGEWFTDDIVPRFREFLRVTFGEDALAENIAFIETALGKLDAKTGKVKPVDLRTFLARDFYKEHVRTYKKRPIYWMFSSPEGNFQALIYLHRYTRDTVNLLLNDYVREFIGKLEEKHRQLTAVSLNEAARPGDRTKAAKELGKIDKMLKEMKAWERDVILPLAQQRIELDLDDGVKVNYQKFKGAVADIPGLEKEEEE